MDGGALPINNMDKPIDYCGGCGHDILDCACTREDSNMIYNEDCIRTMGLIPPGSVDMILTSPPYDNLRTYNGYSYDFERTAELAKQVLKPGGIAVWVVADQVRDFSESGTSHRMCTHFLDTGWNLVDTMIFAKINPFTTSSGYLQAFEYMLVTSRGRPVTMNVLRDRRNKSAGKKASFTRRHKDGTRDRIDDKVVAEFGPRHNIWYYNVGFNMSSKSAHRHPAIFPEKLAEDHIRSWSNPGELVYDPFMGSGTTARAAVRLNRRYLGSEISFEYCRLADELMAGIQTVVA